MSTIIVSPTSSSSSFTLATGGTAPTTSTTRTAGRPAAAPTQDTRSSHAKDDTAFGVKFLDYAPLAVDLGLQVVRSVTEGIAWANPTYTDGVKDSPQPATFFDVRLPTFVNYNKYATDDTRNWLAFMNGGTMLLRGTNNLLFPQVTDYGSLDDATSQSTNPLVQGLPLLGDNPTKDLNKWFFADGLAPITSAMGDTFAARSQMAVTEHGLFGITGSSTRGTTTDHNLNSLTNIGLAFLMGAGTMSNISPYAAQRLHAQNAYKETPTGTQELRALLGDAADSYTDEEIAEMAEAAQGYAGSTDPEAFNTWWFNKYGDAITAEQMLQNMAANGAQKISLEPFPTLGDYLAARAVSTNVVAMGNEALLRSHAINQMIIGQEGEGENSWAKTGFMALAAGGQILLNEGVRTFQKGHFDSDPDNAGEINPYNFTNENGDLNLATAASITTQLGTIPMALAANLTAHPDTMAQYFGENIAQISDAIFSPEIHYGLALHGNPTADHFSETAALGTLPLNNAGIFYAAEAGLGGAAQYVYGIHQGRALREGIAAGNAAYALPLIIGAAALGAKYIHYATLARPDEAVARDLEAHGYNTDNIMSNNMSDVGLVLLAAPAVGWGLGIGTGLLFKGLPDKPGEPAPVRLEMSGPSGSIAGASVSTNLSGLRRSTSMRPTARPVG